MRADVIVIGGGTVGAAIAYGLARRSQRVILLDGDDRDHRAARANFGLVWVQGKGGNMPAYHEWTRRSSDLWPDFYDGLKEHSGQDVHFERKGGLHFCLGEAEFEDRHTALKRLHNQLGGTSADWEMLDRRELEALLPDIAFGPDVTGASLGRRDGHVNPLRLLGSLHGAAQRLGVQLVSGQRVHTIEAGQDDFTLVTASGCFNCARIVIAAGLGSGVLAQQVGLEIPVRPQRGQILVTERLSPMMHLPASEIRQTREGSVMIGATQEEAGFDASTTSAAARTMSARALRTVPALADATLVRQWAGLRIMTPDSYPVYVQSPRYPGAFVALCHSGVTLAAVHAEVIAGAVVAGALPAALDVFHPRRFDVPQAA